MKNKTTMRCQHFGNDKVSGILHYSEPESLTPLIEWDMHYMGPLFRWRIPKVDVIDFIDILKQKQYDCWKDSFYIDDTKDFIPGRFLGRFSPIWILWYRKARKLEYI